MRNDRDGFTIIELMLTIVVTGILAVILMGLYTNVISGGVRQKKISAAVNTQLDTKAKMDRLFSDIDRIEDISPVSIEFTGKRDDKSSSLIFRDKTLFLNNEPYISKVESCKWEIVSDEKSDKAFSLITWEVSQPDGIWAGGAERIRD